MIAVDAMGGDFAPDAVVRGAYNAAKKNISIRLYGDCTQLTMLLDGIDSKWRTLPILLFHCSQVIAMGDEASKAVVKKTDSSLVRAVKDVSDGHAQAIVSAGNSGAALVAGTLIIKRVNGILRPAFGSFVPTRSDSVFCLDLGANTDCKPEYLEQFALMGHVYVNMKKNITDPRIALLSNGEEPYKGSSLVKETYKRLETSALNFVGNVESRDIFNDKADVVVCDGFAGNIMLKAIQGTVSTLFHWLNEEASRSWGNKIRIALSAKILRTLKEKTDYSRQGGALLLGVKHSLVIAHGNSNAQAIEQAIIFAHDCVEQDFVPQFNDALETVLIKYKQSRLTVAQKVRSLFINQ